MATPYSHTHVSHVGRTGRRRSQSLSIPKADPESISGLNSQQKQFLVQLQKVRKNQLKANNEEVENVENVEDEQNEKKHRRQQQQQQQPVVTQVSEVANTSTTTKVVSASIKKPRAPTGIKPTTAKNDDEFHPTITKVSRAETTKSTKNLITSEELPSTSGSHDFDLSPNDIDHDLDDEQPSKSHQQILRVPRAESTISMVKNASTKPKTANITVGPASKSSNLDSSNGSAYPFLSSSKNLMSRSEIFDQDSCPTDSVENDKYKRINISGNAKTYDQKIVARSSASLMTAVIATILGIIAFAFGLAALILVQRLRSTVENELVASQTTSSPKYSSSWQTACSNYKQVDEPSRSVHAVGYALGCDDTSPFLNRTTPIWIRFVGTGGTQLPLTTPGMNICGSEGTGYFVGTMPEVGEVRNATACFTWYTSVCRFSLSIGVANCGTYYVYYLLPAPACMMRYCTI